MGRLLELPAVIRKVVCTTDLIEGFHSALRKVARGKAAFPNDGAVCKALFLRTADILKKWAMPIPNWAIILGQLDVLFPDLMPVST